MTIVIALIVLFAVLSVFTTHWTVSILLLVCAAGLWWEHFQYHNGKRDM